MNHDLNSTNLVEEFDFYNRNTFTSDVTYDDVKFVDNFPTWFSNLPESEEKQKMRDVMLSRIFSLLMSKNHSPRW